jgi:hypothetical protein
MAVRTTVLTIIDQIDDATALPCNSVNLCEHLLRISRLARKSNQLQQSLDAVHCAKAVQGTPPRNSDIQININIEEVKLLWLHEETRAIAINRAEALYKGLSGQPASATSHLQSANLLRLLVSSNSQFDNYIFNHACSRANGELCKIMDTRIS